MSLFDLLVSPLFPELLLSDLENNIIPSPEVNITVSSFCLMSFVAVCTVHFTPVLINVFVHSKIILHEKVDASLLYVLAHTLTRTHHSVGPARRYSTLPDLPSSLPLAFCYYVTTVAIADRKVLLLVLHLEDKF